MKDAQGRELGNVKPGFRPDHYLSKCECCGQVWEVDADTAARWHEAEEAEVVKEYHPGLAGEELHELIAEYMNLVDACRQKGVVFEPVEGRSLDEHRETINSALIGLGYKPNKLNLVWSGEIQLTSS